MSKYMLTGSNGFIGSAMGKFLIEKGHQVRTIPRDILDKKWNLQQRIEQENPDYIINFAGYGNHYHQENIKEMVKANILNIDTLFSASKNVNTKLITHISTSSVNLIEQTPYSITKKAGQDLSIYLSNKFKKKICIIKPYSVFGEGEADFRFIPTVIRSAIKNDTLNLVEEPVHDWIYIKDFVKAVYYAKGGILEVGTGKQYSNKEIVQKIEKIHGKNIQFIKQKSLRTYDNEEWISPENYQSTPIDVALKNTYEYYKERYEKQ